MVQQDQPLPSKTKLDKAGDVVKRGLRDDTPYNQEIDEAIAAIGAYRASFGIPLESATNKLRAIVLRVTGDERNPVASRPKTFAAIAAKLYKLPTRLTQIEDIAGCRVVLGSLDEVYAVVGEICNEWPEAKVEDKNDDPNMTGYRAVHVLVVEADKTVEIQVRTERQHLWADAVEEWGAKLGINRLDWNLKDGGGPDDLVLYFTLAANRLARMDAGLSPDAELEHEFNQIRDSVRHYFADSKTVDPPWAS